jgi:hypothetical protein
MFDYYTVGMIFDIWLSGNIQFIVNIIYIYLHYTVFVLINKTSY